jgi:nitronate monooxygenase
MFAELSFPLIVAPMAGGPSTPELVAAATNAGAFGFLAGGYLSGEALAGQIRRARELTTGDFGVNLFVPGNPTADPADLDRYAERMREQARQHGVETGEPDWDDDRYAEKLDVVVRERVAVVSFTFGAPPRRDVERVREAGGRVLITVTSPQETRRAVEAGPDGLVVQGFEAGAHRGLLADDAADPVGGESYGLLAALRLVAAETDLPLVGSGGLVHGADVAAVLVAGAAAAQLGTAFLRADEAGTKQAHRDALDRGERKTTVTRAFSGRPARGLLNRFIQDNSAYAPAAYPQLNNLTKPLRAAAAEAGDVEMMSLWAGQTYPLARSAPAADIVRGLREEARAALRRGGDMLR